MIVAAPARALRQIPFQHVIDHRDGIAHDRIVRRADAQADQLEKIAADNVPGRMKAAAVGHGEHGGVGIGVRIRRVWVRGIDANVVTRETFDQFAAGRDGPFLQVRGQPVGVLQE